MNLSSREGRPGRDPHLIRRRRARSDDGAVLVEAAFVIPVVLLFLFGMIDFGVIMNNRIGLQQAVREGAREAVVAQFRVVAPCTEGSSDKDRLACTVREQSGIAGQDQQNVEVHVRLTKGPGNEGTTAERGDSLSVCAQVPAESLSGITAPFIGTDTQLRVESTMLVEQPSALDSSPVSAGWSWCG